MSCIVSSAGPSKSVAFVRTMRDGSDAHPELRAPRSVRRRPELRAGRCVPEECTDKNHAIGEWVRATHQTSTPQSTAVLVASHDPTQHTYTHTLKHTRTRRCACTYSVQCTRTHAVHRYTSGRHASACIFALTTFNRGVRTPPYGSQAPELGADRPRRSQWPCMGPHKPRTCSKYCLEFLSPATSVPPSCGEYHRWSSSPIADPTRHIHAVLRTSRSVHMSTAAAHRYTCMCNSNAMPAAPGH